MNLGGKPPAGENKRTKGKKGKGQRGESPEKENRREEAPTPKERRKMSETEERPVSDNTVENARRGNEREKKGR